MEDYSLNHDDTFDSDSFNSSTNIKLQKNNIESSHTPTLHRALSTVSANQTLVNNQRNVLAKNYRRTAINDDIVTIDHNDADASFILPNLYELPEDIRNRVMDNLVDIPTMASLEETRRLNWWVDQKLPCSKLYPLVTSGDGNCLLHATSLAMWGFHDHFLSMRKALNETLITSKPNNSLYRRWRWAQSIQNRKYDLVFSEQEWNEEWENLLRLSSAKPRISQTKLSNANSPVKEINHSKSSQQDTDSSTKSSSPSTRQYYESLEEFHVYVLANNIRRPIIIYSDTILRTNKGEAISPIEFGGIYLPLEIPPDKCHKQPIFLAFDAAHFSALVSMESTSRAIYRIPLIDIDTLDLLPIHFLIDPGLNFQWPIDEELSDETIHSYPNYEETRMDILGKYLNLSKEYSSLNNFIPSTTVTDDQTSITDHLNNTSTTTVDSSSEINSTIINKKSSRSSFSKIIRRTFLEPFSSTKRVFHKHQHRHSLHDASIIIEDTSQRRKSSPLLNRHTNMLTIILTNFQPKRPKTSDNMIKNYVDTCIKEYQQENPSKQINHDNENIPTNPQSSLYVRHHPSSTIDRLRQELASAKTPSTRTIPSTRSGQKDCDIDDNEDSLPIGNGQFSTKINFVQQTRRKSNQLTQSNGLEMTNDLESHMNKISNKTFPSQK